MEPLSFPLYQGFFPQLVLGVDELLAYRRLGKERVSQLVRIVEDADCVYNWSDVKLATSSASSSSSSATTVKCQRAQFLDVRPDSKATQASTFVKASVHIVDVQAEEILGVLAKSKTRDLRKTMAFLHGDSFMDAQTLLTFPTSANSKKPAYSYRAIKWCAFKGRQQRRGGAGAGDDSKKSKKKALDFCYLEYAGRKKAQPGSTVLGFIVQESMSREREVPHLDSYGITRGRLSRTGIIISRTHQSNILKVTSICQIDGALHSSVRHAMEEIMLENVAAIHRVKGLLERQRMGKLQYLEEWEWVANSDRKACAVCLRGFYFHRKHHCQTCGEVVCSSCAPLRELDEPLFDSTQIRVCTVCLASAGSQSASTERTSSNGGTEAYIRDLQNHPKQSRANNRDASYSPDGAAVGGPFMRHTTRPSRLSEESSRPRSSDLSDEAAPAATAMECRPRRSSVAGRAPAPATTEALSKLAYHMQQIRETINIAMSEVDQSNSQSCDDVYEKILQIRETLDISGSEFDAVLASIGGGGGSGDPRGSHSDVSGGTEYNSSDNSERDRESLYYSEELSRSSLYSRSSLSQSSLGDSNSSSVSRSRSSRYGAASRDAAPLEASQQRYSGNDSRGDRSPGHKDSLFSDQTVVSSVSKQSSNGMQQPPTIAAKSHHLHYHHQRHSEPGPEQLLTVNKSRGIHRLAQKIEKLQQRLEDSHRAASSVASVSDLESEPEPEVRYATAHNRGRRSSYVESKPAASPPSTSEKARITSEMVQALRGVMESREVTRAPTAWRRSSSSSNHDASSTSSGAAQASRSRQGGGAPPLAPSGNGRDRQVAAPTSSSSSASSSAVSRGSKFQPVPGTTFFVYDQSENVNKLQRLSVSLPSHENQAHEPQRHEEEDQEDDDEFSISSSEDALSMAGGRDDPLLLYPYPPSSSGASLSSLSCSDSLDEAEDVASLPDYYASKLAQQQQQHLMYEQRPESDNFDEMRRLVEDVSKLPARMRTSSGQSSGAPSQENHDF